MDISTYFLNLSEEDRNKSEIANLALLQNGNLLEKCGPNVKDNIESVKIAIENSLDGNAFKYASERLQNNTEVASLAIRKEKFNLLNCGKDIWKNEECLNLINGKGSSIFAESSDEIKNDIDIAKVFLERDKSLLNVCGNNVWKNKECLDLFSGQEFKEFFEKNIDVFKESIFDDFEIAHLVLEKEGSLLKYFNDNIKDNSELIKVSIENSFLGSAFEYASERLQNDIEFIKSIVLDSPNVLKYANDDVFKDNQFLKFLRENKPERFSLYLFNKISPDLLNDATFIKPFLSSDINNSFIKKCGPDVKNNLEIMKVALKVTKEPGDLFRNVVPDSLKNNKDFIDFIFEEDVSFSFGIAGENIKKDKDFIMYLLDTYPTEVRKIFGEYHKYEGTFKHVLEDREIGEKMLNAILKDSFEDESFRQKFTSDNFDIIYSIVLDGFSSYKSDTEIINSIFTEVRNYEMNKTKEKAEAFNMFMDVLLKDCFENDKIKNTFINNNTENISNIFIKGIENGSDLLNIKEDILDLINKNKDNEKQNLDLFD